MAKRAKREGVLIDILRVSYHHRDEVSASNIVGQVRVKLAAEWIVTHVLDYGPAIGIGMRFVKLIRRGGSKSLQQERLDRSIPCRVNYGLMGQNRIRRRGRGQPE